jgi:hypothetical protein
MSLVTERPVVAKIADVLFARLEALVTSPNEPIPIAEVIRPKKIGGYTPKHRQIVLTRGASTRNAELDCPGNPPAVCWVQVFNIRITISPSEKDPTPIELYEDALSASVYKAVTLANLWHTMDGNAIDAAFADPENVDGDGGYEGINLPLVVTYRVSENDPYAVRA